MRQIEKTRRAINMVRQKYGAAERRGKRAKGCFARFHWKERYAKERRRAGRAARRGSLCGAEVCEGKAPHKRNAAAQKERRRTKGTPPHKRNAAAQKKRKGSPKAEIFIRFSKSCRRTLIKYDILDKSVLSGAKEIFGRIYGKENNRVRYRR